MLSRRKRRPAATPLLPPRTRAVLGEVIWPETVEDLLVTEARAAEALREEREARDAELRERLRELPFP